MSEPSGNTGLKLATKIKIGVAVLMAAILVGFVLLNMEVIEVNFLVAQIKMRRSVMILGVFLSGFLVGWMVRAVVAATRKRTEARVGEKISR